MLISIYASIFEIESKEIVYPDSRDSLVKIIRQLLLKTINNENI